MPRPNSETSFPSGARANSTTHATTKERAPIPSETSDLIGTKLSNSPAQLAGILCNDPQFQKFAAIRSGLPDQQFNASAAAEYLRTVCNIITRRDLDLRGEAFNKFNALRTDFDAWRGRIAAPREGYHDG